MRRLLKPLYWAVTLQLPRRIREQRITRRIHASGLFDLSYYRTQYPDLDTPGLDPVVHYVRHGAAEGRDPNEHFDSAFYLASNPDVRLPRRNPLDHFHSHGWREGRNPHPDFDVDYYLAENPDVRELGSDPLHHYLHSGRALGRLTLAPGARAPADADTPKISIRRIHRPSSVNLDGRAATDDPVIICVAHVVPYPPRAGNHQRIYRYLRWLERRGYQVIMVSSPLPGEELDEEQLEESARGLSNLIYCHREGELRVALASHLWPLIEGLEGQAALRLAEARTPDPSDGLSAIESTFCPDVTVHTALHIDAELDGRSAVISHYVFSTRFLGHLRSQTLKIIDTIDVFSTKLQKVAAYGIKGEMILSDEDESRLLQRGDVLMAIQADEARELQRLVPDREVIVAGIDFEPAPEASVALPPPDPPTILLIASGNAMNRQGLADFLQYAWPLLRRDHPDATLLVAGAISASVPAECSGVRVLGFVDSLDALYRMCHVVINPAVAGTGLKIKTVEALAAHRRIVSWPLGVDGMPVELKRLCYVASDWYQFYLHVSDCLRSEKRESYSMHERDQIAVALSAAHNYKLLGEALDRHCRSEPNPKGEFVSAQNAQPSLTQSKASA